MADVPSQPQKDDAYETEQNPVAKEPAECAEARRQSADESESIETRIPTQQSSSANEATQSSLARGIHGTGPGEETKGLTEEDVGRHNELDAEQMAAPGEGDVAAAVEGPGGKSGASGSQPDLAADLERKKAEQAPLREAQENHRKHNFDVGAVLGQTGGSVNPVGRDNYPNSGD